MARGTAPTVAAAAKTLLEKLEDATSYRDKGGTDVIPISTYRDAMEALRLAIDSQDTRARFTIQIGNPDRPDTVKRVQVIGYIDGPWGIHKGGNGYWSWTVTHLKTGMSGGCFTHRFQAITFARLITPLLAWDAYEDEASLRAALGEAGRDVRGRILDLRNECQNITQAKSAEMLAALDAPAEDAAPAEPAAQAPAA